MLAHIVVKLLGWTLVAAFIIGGLAFISGDLRNSDNIGGAVGDVVGAGLFGGILGDDGLIGSMADQQERFSPSPNDER